MGWKTRVKGTPNQIGQSYQESEKRSPYASHTRRKASGSAVDPQPRSIDGSAAGSHLIIYSPNNATTQQYFAGKLHHEGYYTEYPDALKAAQKHGGVVTQVQSGVHEGSYEVHAPISPIMKARAIVEAKKSGD